MRLVYEPILPKEYTRLEYLECTGTQYIDTGYTITEEDNIDAIYDIMLTNNSSRGLMGYSLTQVGYWGKTASNTYELGGGNTQVATGNRDIVRFKRDVISSMRQDTDLYVNDVVVGHAQRSTTAETGPFQIFACRGSFKMAGKLYGAILKINDEQIRKFIPALRNSDSEPGMYDIVTGTFYTNAGTGTFNYKISKEEDIVDNPRYQQVEYIESTGSQYIDTGFIPNQDTRVISEFEYTKDPGNIGFIFGAGYSATDRAFELYPWTNNWNSPYGNTNIIVGTSSSLLTSGKIYADKNKNTILIRYIDGTEQTGQTDYTEFTVTNRNMWLFSINRGNTIFLADCVRLYSCKIYDNGVLVRNFIPVIRKIDNKPGMFDKITKQFYTNAGTGDDFLYGNKINQSLPKMYEKLEYLESTGTQYIDTGVIGKTGIKVSVAFMWLDGNIGNDKYILGSSNYSSNRIYFGTYKSKWMYGYGDYYQASGIQKNVFYDAEVSWLRDNQYVKVNGTNIITETSSLDITNNTTMYLFSRHENNSTVNWISNAKIYYCKIWDNDVLVRNYVPALRKSDNKPGMYDFVSGQFFTNLGTGEFTYDYPVKPLSNSKLRLVKTGGYTIYDDLYKEVEYLETDGISCYIDTGLNYFADFEVGVKTNSDSDRNCTLSVDGSNMLERLSAAEPYWILRSSKTLIRSNITVSNYVDAKYKDGVFSLNGTVYGQKENIFQTGPLLLCATNNKMDYIMKVYFCKLWDSNGILVRDFVPVIRIGDNKPGMYDKKNKVFYTNAGTGEFIYPTPTLTKPLITRFVAGGYVASIYKPLQYLQASGTQYIDTGVKLEDIYGFKVSYNGNTSTTKPILGRGDDSFVYSTYFATHTYLRLNSAQVFTNKPDSEDLSVTDLVITVKDGDYELKDSSGTIYVSGNYNVETQHIGANYPLALNSSTCCLFGVPSWRYSNAKIYNCIFYDIDENIIHHYVPVLRTLDNKPGMYDKVTGQFFTNQGTGDFTYA